MSLLWRTAATHHPRYEVGEPEWSDGETQYDNHPPSDKVRPESMGLPYRDPSKMRFNATDFSEDTRVPTHTLVAGQDYLYKTHVHNLASLPAEAFDESHHEDPVTVLRTKSGHHLVIDGHHRAAAAIMRGDKDVRVQMDGAEV